MLPTPTLSLPDSVGQIPTAFNKEQGYSNPYGGQQQILDLASAYQQSSTSSGPTLMSHAPIVYQPSEMQKPPTQAAAKSTNGRRRARSSTAGRLYPLASKSSDQPILGSFTHQQPPASEGNSICMERGRTSTPGSSGKGRRAGRSCGSYSDDDSRSNEDKETERRTANNTRER